MRTRSPATARAARLLAPERLLAVGVLAAVAAFSLWVTPSNPPGFIRDEASIALNAFLLSQNLHDENGALVPLYFPSFGDYKSPLFVYALAAVFRVTGPDAQVARLLAAVCILAAILVVGLVARRRSGSSVVALAIVALGGTTPWLFELGRVAYETVMEPLVVAVLVAVLESTSRLGRWTYRRAALVGTVLAALFYVYAGGRLLAVLAALALVAVAGRGRWRFVLGSWIAFAVALLPAALYWHRHPGALTSRYEATTFVEDGMSIASIVWTATTNYLDDVNLGHWIVSGDPTPYVHTWGAGMLLASLVALAVVGLAVVLTRHRDDPWWRYVVVLLLLTPIPAALTEARHYALRLAPLPIALLVLAVPALEQLWRARARWQTRVAVVVLAAVGAAQFAHFLGVYRERGPARSEVFEAGVTPLLARAFAERDTIYVDHDDRYALTHARWYAATHGIPSDRVVRLADGGVPPPWSEIFGRYQECDFDCRQFARAHDYWLALGPAPS